MDTVKPTVGRIVHYLSHGSPNGEHVSEVRAAIITKVQSDDMVCLAVLNPTGMFFNMGCRKGNGPGMWNWPPRT